MNVRPAIRNLAIVCAVILIPVATHQLWDYLELRRLIAEVEAIRAKREPVTELEAGLGRSPERGEPQRAGRLYMAAAILAANEDYSVFPLLSGIREWLSGAIAEPPATAGEQLQAVIAKSTEALALADEAGSLRFQGFPAGTAYNYRTADLYSLSRLMAARTIGLAVRGEGDAAIQSAISTLRMRRVSGDLRWFTGFSDGQEVAAILSLAQPTPEALRRLQEAMADGPDRVVDDVLFDRARSVEEVWRRYYGGSPQAPSRYLLPNRGVLETVMRPWITRQITHTLRVWAELVEAASTPWPARVDAAAAMASKHGRGVDGRTSTPVGPVAAILRGAHYQRLGAYQTFALIVRPDDLVNQRASVAAIAVERYRRDHAGALPGGLQDLVPQYLDAVPQDPVTGQALLFKKEARSYTIYSVGTDKQDNGGDLNSELLQVIKQGHGRRTIRGADLGVRVVLR
ncbi:MAG: hypothetical protein Q8O42_17920 [Acidobacteriota bacterium]|nr:hypothetical protein [Acidobacteriota bacterium]